MKCNDSEISSDFQQWLKILRARDGERDRLRPADKDRGKKEERRRAHLSLEANVYLSCSLEDR